ncbi:MULTISPECIES: deoxyguanosinetriphosphate triphosphohydrolase family protein [Mycolicibacterium]|jgi:dGTPase|uniref:deoxyguanosinetriphosphate triphosphohydrolase family protein n=1 Tax=Mycolicibacterium TaxID=1866885 RepID=UPI0002D4F7B9|nr:MULTISPECIES: dNTP triphosphohydrolase [Mycolicibacterium]
MPPRRSTPRTRVFAVEAADDVQAHRDERPSKRTRREDDNDARNEGQRDRDRIIYSPSWRRLGGVTQVVTPFTELPLLHNRLTHSEKVAQVARSIADRLIGNDGQWDEMKRLGGFEVDTCEAAGLAHDLGHPPFGHIGEEVLDKVAQDLLGLPDGFEGNAQTLRILTIGKSRSNLHEGLDLTYATIAAVAKYPWKRAAKVVEHDSSVKTDSEYRKHWKKFNAYTSEYELLRKAREYLDECVGPEIQSLEASVMDVADDITYAVHDLEDFYLAGILDVSLIQEDLKAYPGGQFSSLAKRLQVDYPGWFSEEVLTEAIQWARGRLDLGFSQRKDRSAEREAVARTQCSKLIEHFIDNIDLKATTFWPGGPHIGLKNTAWHQVQVLKEITREYVIRRPDFALLQRGQQQVLERFVEMLYDWSEKDPERLPVRLQHELKIARDQAQLSDDERKNVIGYGKDADAERGKPERAILDYICSLSDLECLQIYYNLSGIQVYKPGMTFF